MVLQYDGISVCETMLLIFFICIKYTCLLIKRYIIDGKVENNVTMNRITTIPMLHRGAMPMLLPSKVRTVSGVGKGDGQATRGNIEVQKEATSIGLK
jgi:hypothetical protein